MYLLLILRLLTPGFVLSEVLGTPGSWIAAAAIYLLCSLGYAGMFKKMGENPAKAFIPVLNIYMAFMASGAGILLFAGYAVSLAAGFLIVQAQSATSALAVFFYAYYCFRMVAAFGMDLPAAAALLLAEPVFAAVLGFGPRAFGGPAKAVNPMQPFNVENIFGEDSPFDADMNLKDEYKDEIERK